MTPCAVLKELGFYPVVKKGRPMLYETAEVAAEVCKTQDNVAAKRRRLIRKEALAAGEPAPVFKRGRHKKYETPEETLAARTNMGRECIARYNERIAQGIQMLLERSAAPVCEV